MSPARVVSTAALALALVNPPLITAAPPREQLRIAYMSGNAGEIDPCG